jgi:hypothetical protein
MVRAAYIFHQGGPMSSSRFLTVTLGALFGLPLVFVTSPAVFGQAHQQPIAQPSDAPSSNNPVMVTECDGINKCANWTFSGKSGYGKWPTGEEAILEVTSLQGDHISIHRHDFKGPTVGFDATYTGDFDHNDVGGTFDSQYQGSTAHGHWYWVSGDMQISLPSVMHLCIANCFTLHLEDGHYVGYNPDGVRSPGSIWTVEKFTPQSVIISRVEPGGGASILTGEMSTDTLTMQGNQKWTAGQYKGISGPFQAAWGSALASVPGTNRERESGTIKPLPPITVDDLIQGAKRVHDLIELYGYFNALFSGN